MLCINFISDDILTRIFSLLHPDDLLGVEVCSKRWKLCCKDDQVWSHHAIRVWDIITHNKPSEYVLIERVKKLSMIALKRALVRVDTNSCLEKIDYQKALVNRLVFRYRDMTTKSGIYRIQFPDWHRNFGDYKASYFYSKKETQRTTIHQSELCAIRWAFHFKHSDGPGLDEQYITTFYDDFTMDSQLHSQKLNWQCKDLQGAQFIQVEQYPPLSLLRLPGGMWRMENMFVWFEQLEPLDPEQVPLF